jgi:hypothetical protein
MAFLLMELNNTALPTRQLQSAADALLPGKTNGADVFLGNRPAGVTVSSLATSSSGLSTEVSTLAVDGGRVYWSRAARTCSGATIPPDMTIFIASSTPKAAG